ncbi:MAG: hypothetical protein F6K28_35840 [Microcoleus sp. SIO2G3]|nr:hypothetical protein [Microcoleus sp. SIO2G3]
MSRSNQADDPLGTATDRYTPLELVEDWYPVLEPIGVARAKRGTVKVEAVRDRLRLR